MSTKPEAVPSCDPPPVQQAPRPALSLSATRADFRKDKAFSGRLTGVVDVVIAVGGCCLPTRWGHSGGVPNESTAIAVTARDLDDYRHMFALDDDTLARSDFLDCASGASAFGAQLRARGGQVLSVDPLYGDGLDAVRERALHNLNHCEQWLGTHTDVINWDHLGSPAAYRRNGRRSLASFSADFAAHPNRYLAASLPAIPLGDDTVDVALCANFLFAYADTLDVDFHIAAITELARIARSEVLIHPLSARDGRNLDDFAAAVERGLSAAGLHTQTFIAPSTWLRGASTMRISP